LMIAPLLSISISMLGAGKEHGLPITDLF